MVASATKRPLPVLALLIVVGIPAGLAVATGSYWVTRVLLGPVPAVPQIPGELFAPMAYLSLAVGIVLLLGLNATWERKYGGRPVAIIAMLFGVVASIGAQLVVTSGLIMLGVSWFITIVCLIGLGLLFHPEVRRYFGITP